MNNDITCNASMNMQKNDGQISPSHKEEIKQNEQILLDEALMQNSLNALKSIGQSQVLMTSNPIGQGTKKSVDIFLQNPELVEAQVDFCDSLVEKGCSLEKAAYITSEVFKLLEKEAKETP